MKAVLGKGKQGPFDIDVPNLIATRLLIQANSGGGKSYIVRKLLETTYGKVQHIVLDMEGDFKTLRERYDYILAGEDGDIPVHPQAAGVMAREFLALKASIIIDLYELEHDQRIRFVKLFLEAMINAKKSLWHPVLVLLDEGHVFAPEKVSAASTGAVVEMASRGRKRGFCLVPATQRLAKLSKDVAAECNNKMIGRTGLVADMKRAAEELGFTSKEEMIGLRRLAPGEFYVFGPSISNSVEKIKIGKVLTTHPDPGAGIKSFTPPATSKVKSVLTKLGDIPKKAQEEIKNLDDAKAEIRKLKAELRAKPKDPGMSREERIKLETVAENRGRAFAQLKVTNALGKVYRKLEGAGKLVAEAASDIKAGVELDDLKVPAPPVPPHLNINPTPSPTPTNVKIDLPKCDLAIMGFLVSYPGKPFTKVQVAIMSGYAHTSGSFNNALGRLNSLGLISRENGMLTATDEGPQLGIESKSGSLDSWITRLGKCERAIFDFVREFGETHKEALATAINYSPVSGSFNNALGRLNSMGLIRRGAVGMIRTNPEISDL